VPLFGTLDARAVTAVPRMRDLDTEAWTLPDAEILQLAFEVGSDALALLPRAMHPAVPFYVSIGFARYPESPVGAFRLAQVRLVGRAGAHPRGLVLGAVASTREAAAALRERWGLPAMFGAVSLMRYHDRVIGTVVRDGATILECALTGPEMISPADVQYIASVTLADVIENGAVRRCIVQVDPHYTLKRADRGRPDVTRFDAVAWGADGVALRHPVSGSIAVTDTDLPQIRFVMDPEIPVVRGTRRIR
jgi:hypothetical protein